MFKREVLQIDDILNRYLRQEGLETPLLQKRVMDAWGTVVGKTVENYTENKFIKNQTLFIKIVNPALRQNLSMMRHQLIKRLNDEVHSIVITAIRFY